MGSCHELRVRGIRQSCVGGDVSSGPVTGQRLGMTSEESAELSWRAADRALHGGAHDERAGACRGGQGQGQAHHDQLPAGS